MELRNTAVEIAAGVIGGIVATRVTDMAQGLLWEVTPESEKAREPDEADTSSAEVAARKLLENGHVEPLEKRVEAVKHGVHFGLGMAWGPVYCWLRRRAGMNPVSAGIASGTALSLVVDETLNPVLGITRPPREYPTSAHVRGLVTHLIWGVACAATAESLRRMARH